jgi:UDP-N-acetylglucosamine--N-acetylmuramyl-(pentapeptide) pyrophosphoryl-undecaprenol N-acetylglucosamine transferase
MNRPARVIFAGGGTGGHLYPAIAIAQEVRKQDPSAVISFIGNPATIEARVVPEQGYPFHPIIVEGFRRRLSPGTFVAAGKLAVALAQSLRILRHEHPDVVVGTGGYVCGPPLFASTLLGVPTLIQEQNSVPGVTTRLLASRVTEVHLAFEETRARIRRASGVHVTGNPIRVGIGKVTREEGASAFGLDPALPIVLVTGGSRGARSINAAVMAVAHETPQLACQLLWGAGALEHAAVEAALAREPEEVRRHVRCLPYIAEMERAYAAADLAVCRAGAMTIAELAQAGCPAILVPYPFAAADHQTGNAIAVERAGAGVLVRDGELASRLLPELRALLADSARRAAMRSQAAALARPRAAEELARAVLRLAGRGSEQ